MGTSRVDIIVPVYNGERFLAETLSAIGHSDYPLITITVVDDGSTDSSGTIAEAFIEESQHPVRIIRQNNAGEAAAVNAGVEKSHGDLLMVVSEDDIIEPDLVRRGVELLEVEANCVVAYPDWDTIDEQGRHLGPGHCVDYSPERLYRDLICVPGPGALFRRSALKAKPARDARYPLMSDFEMWLRVGLEGEFCRIAEVKASWRSHGSNTTWLMGGETWSNQQLDLVDDFFSRTNIPPKLVRHRSSARAVVLLRRAQRALQQGNKSGLMDVARAFFQSPGAFMRKFQSYLWRSRHSERTVRVAGRGLG